jgi:hypothetical protein
MKRLLVTVLVVVLLASSSAFAQNPPPKPAPAPAPSAEEQKIFDLIDTYQTGYWLLAMASTANLFFSYTVVLEDFNSHYINSQQAVDAIRPERQLQEVLLTVSKKLRERVKDVADTIPPQIDDQIALAEDFGATLDAAEAFFKKPNDATKKDAFEKTKALQDKLSGFLDKYHVKTGPPSGGTPAPKQ